ncbi:hypothetical protein A6A04_11355 [Paramagnetospirillum marisnigri]|uniref:Methyltransferase domain-containing protein n=1 Tax=Paramagnetospirillum marisnigri TaxID=1285242 RepID=A0A178MX84_9PROT|nr:class I SAM-dependent methyltransferase [Paramagnetospirillum marisnigri]OAN55249.1 hypothetical protein A6A04_11355 [Paramagnetospirillum marisnigri]
MDETGIAALAEVAVVYHCALAAHGATAAGVCWRDVHGQKTRFDILTRAMDPSQPVTVNDVGSGTGALFAYLDRRFPLVAYCGTDICESMVGAAAARFPDPRARFIQSPLPVAEADWSFASGTFNIAKGADDHLWRGVVAEVVAAMAHSSRIGFAFNLLRPRPPEMGLWGDNPEPWQAYVEERLGGRASLVEHDGGDEWSLLVRRG